MSLLYSYSKFCDVIGQLRSTVHILHSSVAHAAEAKVEWQRNHCGHNRKPHTKVASLGGEVVQQLLL